MKKNAVDLVRNYLKRLSDEDFTWLQSRLSDRMSGDVGDAVSFMSRSVDMDRWLSTAETANDLYEMIDCVAQYADCDARIAGKH